MPNKGQFLIPPIDTEEIVAQIAFGFKTHYNLYFSSQTTPPTIENFDMEETARYNNAVESGSSFIPRIYEYEVASYNEKQSEIALHEEQSFVPISIFPSGN
ncbi:MAG: hypothetical protein ACREC0_06725 [Methylocella sp.]